MSINGGDASAPTAACSTLRSRCFSLGEAFLVLQNTIPPIGYARYAPGGALRFVARSSVALRAQMEKWLAISSLLVFELDDAGCLRSGHWHASRGLSRCSGRKVGARSWCSKRLVILQESDRRSCKDDSASRPGDGKAISATKSSAGLFHEGTLLRWPRLSVLLVAPSTLAAHCDHRLS